MNNVTFFDLTDSITGEVIQWVTIDKGNGEFTSMPKSTYDEQLANEAKIK
jgi:hypothetical protein